MSLITVYNAGTVSVVAGSTQVTGSSTGWVGAGVREGDYLWVAGFSVRIASCEGGQALTLAYPWPSTTMSNVAYEIQYTADVERTLGSAQNVLAALRSGSFGALSSLTPAANKMPYYTGHNMADVTTLTSFGRQVLATTDKDSLQTLLDLVAQSSDLDSTLNRVMKVGAFGLGTTAAPLIADIDSFEAAAGFYKVDARITEGVLPPSSNIADGLIILHPTASQTMQVYLGMTELGRNFIRKSNSDGTWAPWRSIMLDFEFGAGPGSGLDADTVDGYEADAFVKATDFTSGGMLAYIKEVDGSGSGLDADLLDGQHGSFYCNAGNLNAGTVPSARLAGGNYAFGAISGYNIANLGGYFEIHSYNTSTHGTGLAQLYFDANSNTLVSRARDSNNNTQGLRISTTGTPEDQYHLTNKKYVDSAIAALVDSSPAALNTLNELAAALGDDPNFATTVKNSIATKLNTAAFTGSAIMSRITTVDGSGSGLDADLLDGKHASEFFNLNVEQTTEGRINLNGTTGEKIRMGVAGSNSPYISFYAGTTTRVGYLQGTSNQMRLSVDGGAVLDLSNTPGYAKINGYTIMHTGNHGAGSGFDADLLDGQHGSYYRDASNLNTGTISAARLPSSILFKNTLIDIHRIYVTPDSGSSAEIWLRQSGGTNTGVLFTPTSMPGILTLRAYNAAGTSHKQITLNGATGELEVPKLKITESNSYNSSASGMIIEGAVPSIYMKNTGGSSSVVLGTNNESFYVLTDTNNDGTHESIALQVRLNGTGAFYAGDKIWTSGNDGSGSGLDADKLDGLDSVVFARQDQANVFNSTQHIQATSSHEQLRVGENSASNINPFISFYNQGTRVGYVQALTDGGSVMRVASEAGGVFQVEASGVAKLNGSLMWHAGNAGSGSGLDADLLDGNHASAFASSDININPGNGLTGGGNLKGSRTLTLGTPGSITHTSTNSVTTSSHTHELPEGTVRALIAQGFAGGIGTYGLLKYSGSTTINPGAQQAGSNLRWSTADGGTGGTPTGTWQLMGRSEPSASGANNVSLWLRIV